MRSSLSLFAAVTFVAACGAPPPPATPPPAPAASASAVAPPTAEPPAAETPDDDFRKQPPAVPARAPTRATNVEEARLSNGVRVLFVERHESPIVSLQAVVSWTTAPNAPGARRLWAGSLLASPAKGSPSLREAFEAAGGVALTEADVDAAHVAVNLVSSQLEPVVDVLAEALVHPTFAKDAVEAQRGRLEGEAEHASMRDALHRAASDQLLPLGHPYRTALDPTWDVYAKLGLGDVSRLHTAAVKPEALTIVAVGDVTKASLVDVLERKLGGWKAKGAPAAPATPKLATGVHIVDRGDESDADVAVVVPAMARSSKDWFLASLVNQLVLEELEPRFRERVTAGWSSPTARLDQTRAPALWMFGVRVGKSGAAAAVEAILAEHERLAKGELSDERLAATKRAWARWAETLMDRSSDTAWALARVAAYGLALDDLRPMRDAFAFATKDDVKRIASTYLGKKLARVVAVGDAAAMKEPLGKLGLGATTVTKAPKPSKPTLAASVGEPHLATPPKKK